MQGSEKRPHFYNIGTGICLFCCCLLLFKKNITVCLDKWSIRFQAAICLTRKLPIIEKKRDLLEFLAPSFSACEYVLVMFYNFPFLLFSIINLR